MDSSVKGMTSIIDYFKTAVAYVLITACKINLRCMATCLDYLLPKSVCGIVKFSTSSYIKFLDDIPRRRAAARTRAQYKRQMANQTTAEEEEGFDEID
jgi:hypothetical protein